MEPSRPRDIRRTSVKNHATPAAVSRDRCGKLAGWQPTEIYSKNEGRNGSNQQGSRRLGRVGQRRVSASGIIKLARGSPSQRPHSLAQNPLASDHPRVSPTRAERQASIASTVIPAARRAAARQPTPRLAILPAPLRDRLGRAAPSTSLGLRAAASVPLRGFWCGESGAGLLAAAAGSRGDGAGRRAGGGRHRGGRRQRQGRGGAARDGRGRRRRRAAAAAAARRRVQHEEPAVARRLRLGRLVQLRLQPGGAGAADAALLLLAAGHGLRRAAPDLLRPHGQLDRLPHQRPLRRVPRPQGEGRRQLQEPRHPVVRGPGRAPGPVLEGRRARLQLHVPALRLGHPADRLRKQHLLHQRPAGQADVDVHLRRVLRHHRLHPLLPQLPRLVLPRPRHDHLHRLVPHHRRRRPRPGRRRHALGPEQARALLHRRHQHPLHFRRPRGHCRDHARDVEAAQVQVHLPAGDAVRVHADAAVGGGHVLGVRRPAADALERLLAAAADRVARRGGDPDAGPPVHHVRVCVHPALLRVGEGGRDARHRERPQARAGAAPHRRAHLVPRHHLPLLRAHQLRRRRAPRQLHRLRHPRARPHAHVPLGVRQIERRGEAAVVPAELVGDVRGERVRGGVGAGRRLRARRLGQRHQLRQAGRHVRPLRQVLPVPAQAARRVTVAGAAAPLGRRAWPKSYRAGGGVRKRGPPRRETSLWILLGFRPGHLAVHKTVLE